MCITIYAHLHVLSINLFKVTPSDHCTNYGTLLFFPPRDAARTRNRGLRIHRHHMGSVNVHQNVTMDGATINISWNMEIGLTYEL